MSEINSNKDVLYQISRLVIPFSYANDYKSLIEILQSTKVKLKTDAESHNMWALKDLSTQRLFRHIDRSISSSSGFNETIGKRFVLTDVAFQAATVNYQGDNKLFYRYKQKLSLCKKDIKIAELCISSVELFVFESNVGFLIFDLEYELPAKINDVIDCNYFIKSLNRQDSILTYNFRNKDGTSVDAKLEIYGLIASFLKDFDEVNYFENVNSSKGSNRRLHALVYNSVILDKAFARDNENWESLLAEYIFRMRRSFKESYKPSPEEFDLDNHSEVIRMFANSYWGVSLEGMANVVYLVDDDNTNKFFTETYTGYLKATFFYLYIFCLHQRYALIKLSDTAAQLPNDILEHISEDDADEDSPVTNLRMQIATYTLRCYFSQISNVTHHTKLYELIRKTLRINELMQELHSEIEVLDSIAELRAKKRADYRRQKEKQQKKIDDHREKKFKDFVYVFSSIFFGVSATSTVYSFYNNITSKYNNLKLIPVEYTIGILWLFIISGLLLYIFGVKRFLRKK